MNTAVRKKYRWIYIIIFCSSVFLPWQQSYAAYINVPDYTATVAVGSSGLNVRETANWGRIIDKIYNGTTVRVLAHDGIWRQVYYSGQVRGWVSKDYLRNSSATNTGCSGRNCANKNPSAMNCNAARTEVTPWILSYRLDLRLSQDFRAAWIRHSALSHTNDYAWVFASDNAYYLDTRRIADGIRSGRVQAEGFQLTSGTRWSNMVTMPYMRVCAARGTANYKNGDYTPDWRNCTSLRYIYRNPYVSVTNRPPGGPF